MTIKQVQLANTFDVWRIATNDLINIGNDLVEGNLQTTGTISLTNPSGFQENVSLNVKSGMIYGDAGLLSNVGKPGSIVNNKLQNNSITINNNNDQIKLTSNTISLGDSVYLNVTNLAVDVNDTSTSNIPSANIVNISHRIATFANVAVSASFNRTNAVSETVNAAYVLANTINITTLGVLSDLANNFILDGAQFNAANAAFNVANISIANVNYVNVATEAAFALTNIAVANVNFVNTATQSAFAQANIAIANVNFVNVATQAAFAQVNVAVANVNFVNTAMTAAFEAANASFANANNSLSNVAGQAGRTFVGNLTATGTFTDQHGSLRLQYSSTPTDTSRLLTKNDVANLVVMGTNTSATQSNTYVPENTFIAGDMIRLYNPTSSAQTVVSNAMFVRIILSGSATANSSAGAWRNVSANAVVTLYCINNNTFVLDGPGAQE